jgi:hypothetical protein
MKNTPMCAATVILVLATWLSQAVLAEDDAVTGITPTDDPELFTIKFDNAPLDSVLSEITKLTNVNFIMHGAFSDHRVTCEFTKLPLLAALTGIVGEWGYVLRDVGNSGVYSIRMRTPEEYRASELRRFFDALRREGFTEDQAMQIVLRSLEKEKE